MKILAILTLCFIVKCNSYKILAIFPHNGRSHHIFFTTLIEELAKRKHDVTVINYHSVPSLPNLRQISLQDKEDEVDQVNIEEHLKILAKSDFAIAYEEAYACQYLANMNCKKLMNNREVQELIASRTHFDVVLVEQFVTDCGLAVAYKLNAPAIGMTSHILLPWTYARLGAPNNPAFVQNHFFASGTYPNMWNKIKSAIINFAMNTYYWHVTQRIDTEIVNEVYPGTPHLEELGKNMSLILINQYFPLTGPRLYSSNVVEIGGMHVKDNVQIEDKSLQKFLDNANKDVVYVSFGSVASNVSRKISNEIKKVIEKNSNLLFVWKTDVTDWVPPSNVFLGKWMPQTAIICHPKVVAFVTHSGMLSTTEAMHCGIPIVAIPLFGEQYSNAQSAVESGLGVSLDVLTLNQVVLEDALNTVLQEKYQKKAKELSRLWKDRPLSPMDTTIFWIEYVARNKGAVNMKPPTVDMPLYQYLMLDAILVVGSVILLIIFILVKLVSLVTSKKSPPQKNVKKANKRKHQ
ncbi:hypothetical protein PYW07_012304 [Mythimna separata]|uniref:UDP-glucuronosyltransferase n=1 Tax=Mythimna separata TaxID=271217 RepID=A0AAD7YKY4_MYTSE|nr:hypothetical protein PYW07_012304 [Mythimna separata]